MQENQPQNENEQGGNDAVDTDTDSPAQDYHGGGPQHEAEGSNTILIILLILIVLIIGFLLFSGDSAESPDQPATTTPTEQTEQTDQPTEPADTPAEEGGTTTQTEASATGSTDVNTQ